MGALIGLTIQLTFLAVGLMITLLTWTIRLTMMLLSALFTLIASLASSRRPSA